MKRIVCCLLLLGGAIFAQITDAPIQPGEGRRVLQLSWLIGSWEREQKNSTLVECWRMVDDTLLEGESWIRKGTDSTLSEKMGLLARDSSIYFVADVPHNDSAIYFRLVDVDSLGWLFVNPSHDFPTSIRYQQIADDSMYARIEGVVNGQTKGIDFRFRRVK